jgi:hypothetical protein
VHAITGERAGDEGRPAVRQTAEARAAGDELFDREDGKPNVGSGSGSHAQRGAVPNTRSHTMFETPYRFE